MVKKKHRKESHNLKVQSISRHLGHYNSVCSLLHEKAKDEHLMPAVRR